MSQLSEAEFSQALADFVIDFNAHSSEKWTLHKAENAICAKQSVMVKWKDGVVNRQAYITYNNVYRVPSLWFNVYTRDGSPLNAEESLGLSNHSNGLDLLKNISQNEHPVLGVLFYNIHPCNTMQIMDEMTGEGNYIAKWLSVYGTPIGVKVPPGLLANKSTGVSPSFSTENSHNSP